ncbi:MAG: F0F1 ATP synthase subunit B [Geminicoccaceae bacterium]|nr:F0F1 ATP synthase subunit B [Geminicoccaceae bacterium]
MLEFVLLIALLILAVLVWRPFEKNVLGALDARARRIRDELDEAERLHDEAKDLLARHERELHEGERLADDIRKRAETETKRLHERLEADFEAAVERRTKQAEERIAQEEAKAVADVRRQAASLAVRATRRLLEERLGGDAAQKVMQDAIRDVTQRLA